MKEASFSKSLSQLALHGSPERCGLRMRRTRDRIGRMTEMNSFCLFSSTTREKETLHSMLDTETLQVRKKTQLGKRAEMPRVYQRIRNGRNRISKPLTETSF